MAAQPAQQPPAPVRQAPTAHEIPDDTEWLTNPSQAFQRAAQALTNSQLAPQLQGILNSNAATNRSIVQDRYRDDFKKYGPEIDLYINQLAPEYRTVDNLDKVVKMVRSEHIDEIARERVETEIQRRMSAGGGLRSDGAVAGVSPSLSATNLVDFNSPDLPEDYRQILAQVNMKPRDFEQFLRKYYGEDADIPKVAKDWFEKAKSGKVIHESRAGWRMERQ